MVEQGNLKVAIAITASIAGAVTIYFTGLFAIDSILGIAIGPP